jgi:putative transposase
VGDSCALEAVPAGRHDHRRTGDQLDVGEVRDEQPFCYVAFVIDAYAGAIVGWEGSTSKETRFVESAIRQAAALRSRQGHPIDGAIHHPDAGSQYTSVRFGETLSLSGLRPSIGSVGDAFDNALAETTIGLYKNECVRADSPFRRGQLRNLVVVYIISTD